MDKYNHLNRPVSKKEYKGLTRGLIKHENRKNIKNVASSVGLVGLTGYRDKVTVAKHAYNIKKRYDMI